MLALFLLQRSIEEDGGPEFDATRAFVIAAHDEVEARNFAASYRKTVLENCSEPCNSNLHLLHMRHRDEEAEVWNAASTTCRVIGKAAYDVQSGVLLEDHHWG